MEDCQLGRWVAEATAHHPREFVFHFLMLSYSSSMLFWVQSDISICVHMCLYVMCVQVFNVYMYI